MGSHTAGSAIDTLPNLCYKQVWTKKITPIIDIEASIKQALQHQNIRAFLRTSVLNFSFSLPEQAKGRMEAILKTFMESCARLALSAKIPEPDMSLENWKTNFANAVAEVLSDKPEFENLIKSTRAEIIAAFPILNSDRAVLIDAGYLHMASDVSQVAYMCFYGLDPKYLLLTSAEMARAQLQRAKAAIKAGKKVGIEHTGENGGETIH